MKRMTVQELIDELQKVENKNLPVIDDLSDCISGLDIRESYVELIAGE